MKGKTTKHSNIFRLSNGRLIVRVSGRVAGARVERTKSLPAGSTDADAMRIAAALKDEIEAMAMASAAAAKPVAAVVSEPVTQQRAEQAPVKLPTFQEYCEQWLTLKAKRLRATVVDEWRKRLDLHILPKLGHVRLDNVDRVALEGWVSHVEKAVQKNGKPYAADTVAGWWRLISQIFRDFAEDYELRDPTRRVSPPRIHAPKVRERNTLSKMKLDEFLEAVRQFKPERCAEATFLAFTGARAGEMLGLRWQDVDFIGRVIHLRHSATRGQLNRTKTNDPRTVPMTERLAAALAGHRATQTKDSEFVFPASNGKLRFEQSLAKPFAFCSAAVGQKVTPQILRRTFNTLLLLEGVSPIVIQAIMGHTSLEMTQRYAGIPIASKAAAVDAIFT